MSQKIVDDIRQRALSAKYKASPRARHYNKDYARQKGRSAPVDLYGIDTEGIHMLDSFKRYHGYFNGVHSLGLNFTNTRARQLTDWHTTGAGKLPVRNFLQTPDYLIAQWREAYIRIWNEEFA